jgi:hypothetical protein
MLNRIVWKGLVVAIALAGCAHGRGVFPLTGSSIVPAASGTVSFKSKEDGNKTLQVRVQHLAQPENLPREALGSGAGEGAHAYIVWLQPAGTSDPQNVGVLIPDKNLDAEMTTTTTQDKFDIFITPEPSATQNTPTGRRILQTTVSP